LIVGQKVNPELYRLSAGQIQSTKITDGHKSKWFARTDQEYRNYVLQDHKIRCLLNARLEQAGIASIVIDRPSRSTIALHLEVVKPGIVIGHRGKEVDGLRAILMKKFGCEFVVNVQEVRKPDTNAVCIATKVAKQLEARVQYRRAMKMALIAADRAGIKGISIECSGRIARIARSEKKIQGSLSRSSLRRRMFQASKPARTRSGMVGVTVIVSEDSSVSRKKRHPAPAAEQKTDFA